MPARPHRIGHPPSQPRRRRGLPLLTLVATLVLALALGGCSLGGTSPTATPRPAPSPTAPALALPPGLATPTGTDRKVDSVLLDILAAYQQEGRQGAEQRARDAGVIVGNEVRLTLVLSDSGATQGVAQKVQSMGGRVIHSQDNLLDIAVPVDTIFAYVDNSGKNFLQDLAAFDPVKEVRVTARPATEGLAFPPGTTFAQAQAALAQTISEGVAVTGADKWQAAGITGKGVKVGIIDAGFAGYESLLGTALPAKVTARPFNASNALYTDASEYHGTAVTEIVHAMAPDADLYLAAIDSATDLMQAVKWLVDEQHVQVITMSLGWHITRGDGTGPYADAVNYARGKGVFFVKSAGNEGEGHYAGTYNDANHDNWHEFAPGVEALPVRADTNALQIDMTWDAWTGDPVNYDLYVYATDGTLIASSRNDQDAGKAPIEVVVARAKAGQTYYLRVRGVGENVRAVPLEIFTKNSTVLQYGTPRGSISTPGDAKGAFTVGASLWKNDQLEEYSSQGPTVDQRLKPDLTAPDQVSSVSFSKGEGTAFAGTSAAAPHVAGAAALVFNAQQGATADSVAQFLESRAKDLETPGPDDESGYGRLQLGPPAQGATPAASPPAGATAPATTPAARATTPAGAASGPA
ncbi:MAG TPA: S8 family serine peptidase, partial [Thermomicrobiales bacterium]|nr:S8 family serine peptidase [Thermomicrobiales bacterium]